MVMVIVMVMVWFSRFGSGLDLGLGLGVGLGLGFAQFKTNEHGYFTGLWYVSRGKLLIQILTLTHTLNLILNPNPKDLDR
jgi:hypothetical protein